MVHAKDANFIACLALHQARRDKALGLTHVTTKQKGLVWYYNTLQQEVYLQAFHYGIIKGARARIKQIKKQVNKDTPVNIAEMLLKEALILQEQINKSQVIING